MKNKFLIFKKWFDYYVIDFVKFFIEQVFFEKPWYLFPIRFIGAICVIIFIDIGGIRIFPGTIQKLFPLKFPDWETFHTHVEDTIIQKLKSHHQEDWAEAVFYALYVSQSFYERQGELLRVLPALKKQKFAKELNMKKDISKAISFLKRAF